MSISLQRLLPLFDRGRAHNEAMVLATVVRTEGPTYTKPGAHLLISGSGEYAGLVSGGCLEGDLAGHSRTVLDQGRPQLTRYDMRGPDDLLFGLGSGCEGAMDILLQRLLPTDAWQPMSRLAAAWRTQCPETLILVVHGADPRTPSGSGVFADGEVFGAADCTAMAPLRALAAQLSVEGPSHYQAQLLPQLDALILRQPPPPRVLLLGAGPDAQPVAELAAFLGWHLTVIDHRSHYAQAVRFPGAASVLDGGTAAAVAALASPASFSAAIVMSHHLAHDLAYLRALAPSTIPYIGLLGPSVRRERLLADLGPAAMRIRPRLRAPIGLDLGAHTPEAIALSIIAEVQATLASDASMQPMSRRNA